MAAEKNFENRVKNFLKESGCWSLKYWGGAQYTKAGVPDILACCHGKFIGIELKAEHGKPSALQIYNLKEIDQAGGLAVLLYPEDFGLFQQLISNPNEITIYNILKERWINSYLTKNF